MKEQVHVGTLKMFFKIGHLMLPRYLFYAALFTTAVVVYAAQGVLEAGRLEPAGVIFGTLGAAVSWYECVRMWKERVV